MGPDQAWQQALVDGEFRLQRARGSGRFLLPPRVAEPGTGDTDWQWVSASGMGTVYSVTVVHPPPPAEAYNVVLVDLAEGPRIMSRLAGAGEARIGMKVRARIDREGEKPLLLFDPA
jgi:uncharacterized OB-fold protein